MEELHQYPPRLTLEITRTQNAQEHLKTDVTMNGVEPELKIELIASCPSGILYTVNMHERKYMHVMHMVPILQVILCLCLKYLHLLSLKHQKYALNTCISSLEQVYVYINMLYALYVFFLM